MTEVVTRIAGSGSFLPGRVLTNDELAERVETSDAWIRERTGIKRRHIASEGETTASLGEAAARRALRVIPQQLFWDWETVSDADGSEESLLLRLRFALPPGAYATAFIREVIDVEGDLADRAAIELGVHPIGIWTNFHRAAA